MRTGVSWRVMASCTVVFAAGCSSGADEAGPVAPSDSTVAATVRPGTPDSLVTASSLAESQVSASTVPRPSVPPRCPPSDLAIWTAQVRPYDGGADAVLRVRNVSDHWCEVDLSGSPRLDPGIEPDVWLEPGEWAELTVGPSRDECADTEVVTLAQMLVGGQTIAVPTTAITPCGWSFVAMFPLAPPATACTELGAVATDRWLVVRNDGATACSLSDLVAAGERGVAASRSPSPAVTGLEPGDLAGYPLRPADGCVDESVSLEFDGEGADADMTVDVVVDMAIEPCASIELGPAWPVLDGTSGLLGDADRTPPVDAIAIVATLDPFAAP